jgi:2',3'-cyclic-nucleotide 2'-phosphodiesterase (5'-nucleotidase family)
MISIKYKVLSIKTILVVVLFSFSCQKKVLYSSVESTSSIKVSTEIKDDSLANATIAPYRNQLTAEMNRVIGKSAQPLLKGEIEYTLGNFTADLLRIEAEKLVNHPVDFAIMNHGGLRNTLPQGDITVGHIYELMPFDNEVVVLTINAKIAHELFKFMAQKKNVAVSNMQITLKKDGGYETETINEKKVEEGSFFTLAISDYLANGGDGLTFLTNAIKTEPTNLKIRDVIIKHIEGLDKEIKVELDGRVQLAN